MWPRSEPWESLPALELVNSQSVAALWVSTGPGSGGDVGQGGGEAPGGPAPLAVVATGQLTPARGREGDFSPEPSLRPPIAAVQAPTGFRCLDLADTGVIEPREHLAVLSWMRSPCLCVGSGAARAPGSHEHSPALALPAPRRPQLLRSSLAPSASIAGMSRSLRGMGTSCRQTSVTSSQPQSWGQGIFQAEEESRKEPGERRRST